MGRLKQETGPPAGNLENRWKPNGTSCQPTGRCALRVPQFAQIGAACGHITIQSMRNEQLRLPRTLSGPQRNVCRPPGGNLKFLQKSQKQYHPPETWKAFSTRCPSAGRRLVFFVCWGRLGGRKKSAGNAVFGELCFRPSASLRVVSVFQ